VGLPPRAVFLESAPHPPGFAEAAGAPSRDPVASPADLSPQERGEVTSNFKRFALGCLKIKSEETP
jgi:hypothetical protein